MATYVNDLRLTELATGEGSGTWGVTTNLNLELIGEALGYGTQDCFASDADATTTVADGASDPARAMYFKVTSSASLTATRTLTIAPNTVSRVMLIENATTGSQSIAISQGSGSNVTIASGQTKMVYLDGAGATAAVVDALADLELGTITVADLTATTADINGGTIDGVTIGGASAGAGTFTTLNATGGGALTGTWSDLGTVTTVDINGGTINGVTIGGSSAGAGSFTTLTASDDVNFDSGTLFVDASADAVGIGTTSPVSALQVNVGTNLNLGINEDSSTVRLSAYNDAASASVPMTVNSSSTRFDISGSEAMRIDSSGNVGIGTSSPNATFEVKKGSEGAYLLIGGDNVSGVGRGLRFTSSSSSSFVGAVHDIDALSSEGEISFSIAGSEAMRIDSSGNVGIGTTSPVDLLHVKGTASVIGDYQIVAEGFTGGYGAGISFQSPLTGGSLAEMARITADGEAAWNTTAANQDAGLRFYTALDGTVAEKVRVTAAGDVGIGTSSPAGALHVYNGSAGEQYISSNNSAMRFVSTGGANYIQSGTATSSSSAADLIFTNVGGSGETMRIDSSGNLLVGGTSPDLVNSTRAYFERNLESNSNSNTVTDQNTIVNIDGVVGNTNTEGASSLLCLTADSGLATTPGRLIKGYGGNGGTTHCFEVRHDGDVLNSDNSYGGISDERVKQDITDASSSWDDIKSIRIRKYRLKSNVEEYANNPNLGEAPYHIGVISQEVETVSPGLVSQDLLADGTPDPEALKYVKYSVLYMKAVKALQEAIERIETLEAEVAALKGA